VKGYKMRVPLLQLRQKIKASGEYDPDDILMWAKNSEIEYLKTVGDYKGY